MLASACTCSFPRTANRQSVIRVVRGAISRYRLGRALEELIPAAHAEALVATMHRYPAVLDAEAMRALRSAIKGTADQGWRAVLRQRLLLLEAAAQLGPERLARRFLTAQELLRADPGALGTFSRADADLCGRAHERILTLGRSGTCRLCKAANGFVRVHSGPRAAPGAPTSTGCTAVPRTDRT